MFLKDIFFTLAEEFSYTVSSSKIEESQNLLPSDVIKSLSFQENSLFSRNQELNKIKTKITKNEKVNFYMFLEALGLIAVNIKYNDNFDTTDKILYLIEKMNQSKGINKSQLRTGQTL